MGAGRAIGMKVGEKMITQILNETGKIFIRPQRCAFLYSLLGKLFPRPKIEKTTIMLNYVIILEYIRPLN